MDRYITMIFRGDEDVVTSIAEQIASGQADGKIIMSGDGCQLLGAWATDTNPAEETHHVAELSEKGWTIQHTWECRLAGDLFACSFNQAAAEAGELLARAAEQRGVGRYRLHLNEFDELNVGARVA